MFRLVLYACRHVDNGIFSNFRVKLAWSSLYFDGVKGCIFLEKNNWVIGKLSVHMLPFYSG